jgi:hypothetical protein
MAPQVKDPKTREKTTKLENLKNEPVGIGGRPPKSICINQEAMVSIALSSPIK